MDKKQVPLRFDSCWQSQKLNDIQVQIIEENLGDSLISGRPAKKQCQSPREASQAITVTIPCSKALLSAGSEYFRTRLLSELEDGATTFPLLVGVGEADAAVAVIKSMYEGLPGDATVAQLVLMYKSADRLQATSMGLIAEALLQLPVTAWTWEDVIMVSIIP